MGGLVFLKPFTFRGELNRIPYQKVPPSISMLSIVPPVIATAFAFCTAIEPRPKVVRAAVASTSSSNERA